MIEIQRIQLQKHIAILNAMGCAFVVRDPEGVVHKSTIPFDPAIPDPKRFVQRDYSAFKIKTRIAALKVGDVDVFVLDDAAKAGGITLGSLGSAVSAAGILMFGKGAFTTQRVGETIQCMRTA